MPLALKLLLVAIWTALAFCLALTSFIIIYRAVSRIVNARFARRRMVYQGVVDILLEGGAVPADVLRLKEKGDALVLEGMLLELLVFLRGPLQEAVTRAAEDSGLVDLRLQGLARRSPHLRAEAMEKLGLLRSRKAVPALLARLPVEAPAIRHVVIRALGRIAAPEALDALLDEVAGADAEGLKVVNQALVGYDVECVPALLKRLENPCKNAERQIAILGQIRSLDALPTLAAILGSAATPHMRAAAAEALGSIAHPDSAPALIGALTDSMREVRVQAAWALGRIGDPQATPHLAAALEDRYSWVRIRAAEALAKLGEPGLAVLRRRMESADPELRTLAREMLDLAGERR